jgi:hypothetical protein
MRYLSPARYRELCADGVLQLSEADILLVTERAGAAVQAYRDHIVNSTDPEPGSWIGLALAVHQLPESPLQKTFAAHIALMYEIHAYLGGRVDPLALAGWLT